LNTAVWGATAKAMGLDIVNSFEDNVTFAKWLYDKEGWMPWIASKDGWSGEREQRGLISDSVARNRLVMDRRGERLRVIHRCGNLRRFFSFALMIG